MKACNHYTANYTTHEQYRSERSRAILMKSTWQ